MKKKLELIGVYFHNLKTGKSQKVQIKQLQLVMQSLFPALFSGG